MIFCRHTFRLKNQVFFKSELFIFIYLKIKFYFKIKIRAYPKDINFNNLLIVTLNNKVLLAPLTNETTTRHAQSAVVDLIITPPSSQWSEGWRATFILIK